MNEDKRKLEEAEERQVGTKKQKNNDVAAVEQQKSAAVEEQKSELKTLEIDQENEVSKSYAFVSPEEELTVETEKIKPDDDTLLEDETSGYLEDPGATRNGHLASIEKKDDASNGSCSVLEGEDVAATKNVNEALASSDGATSNKKEGNSRSKEESEEAEPSNINEPISFSENRSSSEEPPEEYEEVFTDREAEDPSGNWEKLVNDVKVMDATPTTENLEEGGSLPVEHPSNPATLGGQNSRSKTLFLGNLSFSIERGDVGEFFKDVGEIVDIQFAMNEDDTFRGFGHIEFATVEAAEKALRELNGKHLLRRRVRLDFKREKGSYTRYSGTETSSNQVGGEAQGQKIFVRGFDKNHGEDKIRSALGDYFGSCGEITRISIPKDRDGCFKGIAYIDFKDADAFNNALELNGSEFGENTLTVEVARSRDIGSGRFGGRGDGGGSGGRGYGDHLGGTGRGYGGHFEGRGRGYGGHFEEGGGRGYGGHSEGGGRGYGGHSEGRGGRGYGGHSEGGGRGYRGHSEGRGGRGYSGHSEGGGRGYGGHSEGGGRGYGGHSEGGGGRGYGRHSEGGGHGYAGHSEGGGGRGYGGHFEGRGHGYAGHSEGGHRGYGGQFEGGRRGYSGHFESRSQGYGGHSGGGSHGHGGHFRGGERGGSGHFGRNRHGYGGHFGGDDNGYSSRVGGGGRGW